MILYFINRSPGKVKSFAAGNLQMAGGLGAMFPNGQDPLASNAQIMWNSRPRLYLAGEGLLHNILIYLEIFLINEGFSQRSQLMKNISIPERTC